MSEKILLLTDQVSFFFFFSYFFSYFSFFLLFLFLFFSFSSISFPLFLLSFNFFPPFSFFLLYAPTFSSLYINYIVHTLPHFTSSISKYSKYSMFLKRMNIKRRKSEGSNFPQVRSFLSQHQKRNWDKFLY